MTPEPVGYSNQIQIGSTLLLTQLRDGGWFFAYADRSSPGFTGILDDDTAIAIFDKIEAFTKK